MTRNPHNRQDSGEKVDSLLKKLAPLLEDMMLMGNKVYSRERTADVTAALLQGRIVAKKPEVLAGETFILEIVDDFLIRQPLDAEGMAHVGMVRLEVEARNP